MAFLEEGAKVAFNGRDQSSADEFIASVDAPENIWFCQGSVLNTADIESLIDGAVDAPDTLGKMLGPERFQQLREARGLEHDGLLLPTEIADTYFHISQQHRSVWTHEIDMRSFSDTPWWNH